MTIGNRLIEAKIEEREKARQQYSEAIQQSKSASLLEQQRPNVFQMNVGNILPNDEIKVELNYTEILTQQQGIYEFIYPTVVGPRYSNLPESNASEKEKWVKNPYLHQNEKPTYSFDIKVKISSGIPIKEIFSPSHKVDIKYESDSLALISLAESEKYEGNRDFIIKYRIKGDKIESGLLLYEGEKENFFLIMLQPPKEIDLRQIIKREYIFIMDVSGSMSGFPLEISKNLLRKLVSELRPEDRFNLILFSGSSYLLSEKSVEATKKNIQSAIDLINNQKGGGGTELLPALERALSLLTLEDYSCTIVIATDGYVRVEKEVFDLIRNNLGKANIFAFGIGTSVNRYLIEGMAHIGMGESFVITNPNEAESKANLFIKYIQSPLLTDININYESFAAYDVEPLTIPSLFAEKPLTIFGKWQGLPKGKIIITGSSAQKPYNVKIIDVAKVKPMKSNSALQYLWARYRINLLSDYNTIETNDKLINEITKLGLKYNLLTNYTSFVAIDTVIRSNGKPETVKQPLPLPQGVSDYALPEEEMLRGRSLVAAKPKSDKFELPKISINKMSKTYSSKTKITLSPQINLPPEMNKQEIKNILKKYIGNIETCCSKKLKSSVSLKITITINEKGEVKQIFFDENALNDSYFNKCLKERISLWKFPAINKKASIEFNIFLTSLW